MKHRYRMERNVSSDAMLLTLSALALALRLFALGKESLWFDEIFSIRLASGPLVEALHAERTNPPLHFILLHFWMNVFGTSAIAARALSVFPSVATIVVSYRLARNLFDSTTARLTALFLTVSTFQIYYAQEARTFAWLLLALTLALLFLERIVFGPPSRRAIYGYCVSCLLALYLHFYAVFFVIAFNAIWLSQWKRLRHRLKHWIVAQGIVVALFLPWFMTMLTAAAGGGQQRRLLLLKLPQAFFSFLAGDTLVPLDESAVQHITATLSANAPALIAAMCGFGFFLALLPRLNKQQQAGLLFCSLAVAVPVLIAFIISFKVMLFEERYLIGVTPPLIMLLSASMVRNFRSPKFRRYAAVASGLIAGVQLVALYNYYWNPRFGRDEWREATAYVDNIRQPGAVLLIEPDYVQICYEYYSLDPIAQRYRVFDDAIQPDAPDTAEMRRALKKAQSVILLRSNYRDDSFLRSLEPSFRVVSEREFTKDKGIHVYQLEAR